MTYYQLSAELRACLMVQGNRQSNTPQGLAYLPGSSLRGALAAHYLRTGGAPSDETFKCLFIEAPVCFPDLLPASTARADVWPLPATAGSCKRHSGFKPSGGHGVGDVLAALAVADLEGRPSVQTCPVCQQDLKPLAGFWNADPAAPVLSQSMSIYQRHTGIDRHTGAVAQSIFYITQGMAAGQRDDTLNYQPQYLSGGLFLTPQQHTALEPLLTDTVFAGADRTRGLGEMALSLTPADMPSFDCAAWSERFIQKLRRLTHQPLPEGLWFSTGLLSPAILVDGFLRPSGELPLNFSDLVAVTRRIRRQVVRGWHSAWQLPKPEDPAVAPGGVYLWRYTGKDTEGLQRYLETLAISGIGLRRAEGFGRIGVCDPLHIQEEVL